DVQETKKVGHGTWGVLCRRLCKAIDKEAEDLRGGAAGAAGAPRVRRDEWVDALKELLEQSQRAPRARQVRHSLTAVASKLFDHCCEMLLLSAGVGALGERAVSQYEKILERDLLAVREYGQCARSKTVESLLTEYVMPALGGHERDEGMSNSTANRRTRILASALALAHCDLGPGAVTAAWEFFLAATRRMRQDNQRAVNTLAALRELVGAHRLDLLSRLPAMAAGLVGAVRRALESACGNNAKLAFKRESARLLAALVDANADCWLEIRGAFFEVMDALDPTPDARAEGPGGGDPEHADADAVGSAVCAFGARALEVHIATRASARSRGRRAPGWDDGSLRTEVLRRAAVSFGVWGGALRTLLAADAEGADGALAECSRWVQRKLVGAFEGSDALDYG
ncbi:MAG: hypothetical protein VXZ39_05325, partial [Planctomycetota bacterium]|nr:hypothetical protein [Planctomycetota bacterium]